MKPVKGVVYHSLRTKQIIKIDEVMYDTRYDFEYDADNFEHIKNLIWAPVIDKEGKIRGIYYKIYIFLKLNFQ